MGTKWTERRVRTLVIVANLLLTTALIPLITLIPMPSRAAFIHVGGTGANNYSSIHDAIYHASPGDVVYVHSGIYNEVVSIDKRVSLIGADKSSTIIQVVTDSSECMVCVRADSVRIANLTLRNASYISNGLTLSSVRDVTLENINFERTSITITGDELEHWDTHHIDTSNTVDGKPIYYWKNVTGGTIPPGAGEVILANTKYVSIEHQEFSESTMSIEVGFSDFGTIVENVLDLTRDDSVHLYRSDNNTIVDNEIVNGETSIHLQSSDGNFIIDNHGSCFMCIWLESSDDNDLARNKLSSGSTRPSYYGILIEDSNDTIMNENDLTGASVLIQGSMVEHWRTHVIATNNMVNDQPLYYWKNVGGGVVPSGAGEVILANVTNVVVEGQNINNGSAGIQVGYSKGVSIGNNNLSGGWGRLIKLYRSTGIRIANNTVTDCRYCVGIEAESSDNNTIVDNVVGNSAGINLEDFRDNTIANNTMNHLSLTSSDNNVIVRNTATYYGLNLEESDENIIRDNAFSQVALYRSHGNTIYHNDIFEQVDTPGYDSGGTNAWDNGYPSGGNYWASASFNDSMSGPGQDQLGSDGIADQPMQILGGSSIDRYPLMQVRGPPPWRPLAPRMLACSPTMFSVTLSWEAPFHNGTSPIVGYRIYRSAEYEDRELIAEVGDVRTYVDTFVVPGVRYRYSVSAVNSQGEGPPTHEVGATILLNAGSNGSADENLRQALIWAGAALAVGLVSLVAVVLLLRSKRKKRKEPEIEGQHETHDNQVERP